MKRKIIILFMILGFICSSFLVCNAFSANRQAMQEKIKNFKQKYGKSAEIVFSDTTGLPYRISGIKTKAHEGEPDEIALSFLSENASFLGVNKNDVKVDVCQDLKEKGDKYVKFKQYYKGLPVEGSKIIIHMKKDKTIDRIVKSKYYPNLDIDIVPSIPIKKAEEIVKKDLGIDKLFSVSLKEDGIIGTAGVELEEVIKLKKELLPVKPELIIYPMNGDKAYLCWQFLFSLDKPLGAWCYYICAHTGKIIHHFNCMQGYTIEGDIYGLIWPDYGDDLKALEFLPTSLTDTLWWSPPYYNWYRSAWTFADENAHYTMNYNSGLTWYCYRTFPYGTRCRVSTDYYGGIFRGEVNGYYHPSEGEGLPSLINFLLSFDTDVTYSKQDCVNIYYHLNHSLTNYYEEVHNFSLGYNLLARAHYLDDPGSWYDHLAKELRFGIGDGVRINNPARSREMILHELQHAVTCKIWNCIPDPTAIEQNAINEAYSDYFACTQSGNGIFGEWVFKNSNDVRMILVNYRYPEHWTGTQETKYTDMLVPASTLWDIRDAFDQYNADAIIFRSIYEEPETLHELRLACRDAAIFLGLSSATIEQIFNNHGIY